MTEWNDATLQDQEQQQLHIAAAGYASVTTCQRPRWKLCKQTGDQTFEKRGGRRNEAEE